MTYTRALIFDVETTGLLPRNFDIKNLKLYPIQNLPYVIQLSYMVYDFSLDKIVESYNAYVKVPVEIPEKITQLTGINKEKCQTTGIEMKDILDKFHQAYIHSDCIIAHNLMFDRNMLLIELQRNRENFGNLDIFKMFDNSYNETYNISLICTMHMSKEFCNIEKENSLGKYIKFPTLTELHEKLFNETPKNMHNSLMDIFICLKCYLKLQHNIAISEEYFWKVYNEVQHEVC